MKLNCLIFALVTWFHNNLKTGLGITRSRGLKGLIPHFFHIRERDDYMIVEDYIPRQRKNTFKDRGESFVLFDGMYRVRIYKLESISTSDTLFRVRKESLLKHNSKIFS